MKRTLIVGNWKMNLNVSEASILLHRLQERVRSARDVETVLAPTMLTLQPLSMQLDRRKFRLAAQNAHAVDEGPYTGEISFTMLRDLVHYVIVGHSDRRHKFNEDLPMIRDKVAAAIRNDISPILCVGETKQERLDKETNQVLHDQVTTALANVTSRDIRNVVIAYEPVWAIGTGVTAKPTEIDAAIKYIRRNIKQLYGVKASEDVRILYGAGLEPEYIGQVLSLECGVDGLLVGGASLDYHKFASIVEAAYQLRQQEESNAS